MLRAAVAARGPQTAKALSHYHCPMVPGNGGVGLQLNYDMRHVGAIRLRSTERVTLTRGPRCK